MELCLFFVIQARIKAQEGEHMRFAHRGLAQTLRRMTQNEDKD